MVRGNSSPVTIRRVAAIAIAGAAALALSACGAGQETQTDTKQSAIAGVNIDDRDLALRDLQVEFDASEGYAAGADAALRVWIGNEGEEEVRLTGVTVRAAEDAAEDIGVVTFVSPAAQAAEAAESASEAPSEDADATGEPDADATTEAPAVEENTVEEDPFDGETAIDVAIAPGGYARLDQGVEGGDYLLIEDLRQDLPVGGTVWVTFSFSNGQAVGVALTIGQSLDAQDRSFYEPQEPAEH